MKKKIRFDYTGTIEEFNPKVNFEMLMDYLEKKLNYEITYFKFNPKKGYDYSITTKDAVNNPITASFIMLFEDLLTDKPKVDFRQIRSQFNIF